MRRLGLVGSLPLFVLLIGCAGGTSKEEHVRYVQCDTVQAVGNTTVQSRFSGRVKAASESDVAFRVAGQIARMNVSQGQFVCKGTVIALLDDRDYRTQLSATEAEYNSVKAEVDRVVELYKKRSVTPNEYDKAVYGLKQITAKLEAHRNALSYTRLIAPFDGYIQKKLFDTGETVAAGMAVVSIVSTDNPEVEINIPTADFLRQGEYTEATATIDGFSGQTFPLELIGINQKANLNQLYTTRFRIKTPKQKGSGAMTARVVPGMTAMVTLHYRNAIGQLMRIPFTALSTDSVWIQNEGKAIRKAVKVHEIKSDGTALVEGLSAGDLIISNGIHTLKEGQPVRALPAKSTTNAGGLL